MNSHTTFFTPETVFVITMCVLGVVVYFKLGLYR